MYGEAYFLEKKRLMEGKVTAQMAELTNKLLQS